MNPYPIMNGTGWCNDPEMAMMAIMRDYCHCEYSATKLYRKTIRSLPYQLMKYNDPTVMASVVQDDLRVLYKNVFDNVEVVVNYNPDDQGGIANESPVYRLEISLVVYDENKRYTLSKILTTKHGEILTIGESVL